MSALKSLIRQTLPPAAVFRLQALDHYLNGEAELRLLSQLVDRRRLAVDIGANIGTYAYFLRRHAAGVVAFEPNPELAARLQALLPDVDVRPLAVSDAQRMLSFEIPLNAAGRQMHELGSVAQRFDGPVQRFEVACTTLDAEHLADVGFIKIDVEQHEREVLRGALRTLARDKPVLLVEVYPLKYQRPLDAEFAFITELGYRGWFCMGSRWHPFESFDPQLHAHPDRFGDALRFMGNNVVFIPAGHPRAARGPAV